MKKIILFILAIALVSSTVFAQSKAKAKKKPLEPFSLVVSAGSNWSIFSNPASSSSKFTQAKQLSGFNIGISGNWPLSTTLSLQAGLRFTRKGSEVFADSAYYHVHSRTRPVYLQVPADLVYTYKLGRDTRAFIGLGAFIAKGVGGKNSYDGLSGTLGDESTVSGNDKIIYGNPGSNYAQVQTFSNLQKFDYGVNGLIGIEYWKFQLTLGYEGSLAKVAYGINTPNPDSKNKSISFTLGFRF